MAARSRSGRCGAGVGGARWRRAAAARRSEASAAPWRRRGRSRPRRCAPCCSRAGRSRPRASRCAGTTSPAARTTPRCSAPSAPPASRPPASPRPSPRSTGCGAAPGWGGLRPPSGCTIFLGFTSNLISSGVRETIRYLVQRNMVDVLVTTAGGVEEDLIKCLAPTYIGDFSLRGQDLRRSGINRIGNLLVPNDNYCKFEDWLMPILEQMVEEQETQGARWTPSRMIARLGKEIDHPESVCYWAQKNNIPVLSPALTDGSLGDMIFFHSYKRPGLVLDIVEDLRLINTQAIFAKKTGMIILGGGLVKHHIANANLMRNGADFSVYVNTAQEFDGSDSGARPDEAVSWGKIRMDATPVKVYADASLVFPLLVAETFAQRADAFPEGTPGD
ncbi:unnamed protein product [Bubo scandiacus]